MWVNFTAAPLQIAISPKYWHSLVLDSFNFFPKGWLLLHRTQPANGKVQSLCWRPIKTRLQISHWLFPPCFWVLTVGERTCYHNSHPTGSHLFLPVKWLSGEEYKSSLAEAKCFPYWDIIVICEQTAIWSFYKTQAGSQLQSQHEWAATFSGDDQDSGFGERMVSYSISKNVEILERIQRKATKRIGWLNKAKTWRCFAGIGYA